LEAPVCGTGTLLQQAQSGVTTCGVEQRAGRRHGQRIQPINMLAADMQGFLRRGEQPQGRGGSQHRLHKGRDRNCKMFAVIEHEQCCMARECARQVRRSVARAELQFCGQGDGRSDLAVCRKCRKIDPPHVVGMPPDAQTCHRLRQPRLADAARPEHRGQAVFVEPGVQRGDIGFAADQRLYLGGRVVAVHGIRGHALARPGRTRDQHVAALGHGPDEPMSGLAERYAHVADRLHQ